MLTRRLSLAVCLLLLASCSFPGSVKPTVKIGLSAPFEGLYRDLGYEALHAVRLAVRQRNEAGGLCDRYVVELVALNDFNEPDEAAAQAREMAVDPGVMGVLGGWSAWTARAAFPAYDGRLPFRTSQPHPALRDNWARLLAEEAARIARDELDARRAALISGPDEDDLALVAEFEREFSGTGREVVSRATPPGEGWLAELLAARPDMMFIAADAAQAGAWIVEARQAGYVGPIVGGPGLGSNLLVDIAGEAAEGVQYLSQYAPVPDDPAFVAGYEELSGGAPPGPVAAWAYTTTQQLLDQIEGRATYTEEHWTCVLHRHDEVGAIFGYVAPIGPVYRYAVRDGQVFQQP